MTRGSWAVLAGTLLALLVTFAWVPTRSELGTGPVEYRWWWDREPEDVRLFRQLGIQVSGLVWRRQDGSDVVVAAPHGPGTPLLRHVVWPVVAAEQVAVLVVGGALLSLLLRRDRRRRAGAAA